MKIGLISAKGMWPTSAWEMLPIIRFRLEIFTINLQNPLELFAYTLNGLTL